MDGDNLRQHLDNEAELEAQLQRATGTKANTMANDVSKPGPTELQLRKTAIDMAIVSRMGEMTNEVGMTEFSADRLLDAAKKFKSYLEGKDT